MARSTRRSLRSSCRAGCPNLVGPDQDRCLNQLELDHDNFRCVLALCTSGKAAVDAALRIVGALELLWLRRGHVAEPPYRCQRVLGLRQPAGGLRTRARALATFATLASARQDSLVARRAWEEVLELSTSSGDLVSVANALRMLASNARREYEWDRARDLYTRALEIARRSGDLRTVAKALNSLGLLALDLKDHSPRTGELIQEGR